MLIYVFWVGGKADEWKAQLRQGTLTDSGGILGYLISKKSRLWKVKAATEMIENQPQSNIGHRIQWVTAGCSWIEPCLCIAAWIITGDWMFVIKTGDKPATPNTQGFPNLMTRLNARLQPWHLHRGPLRFLSRWSPIPRSAPVTRHSSQQPED